MHDGPTHILELFRHHRRTLHHNAKARVQWSTRGQVVAGDVQSRASEAKLSQESGRSITYSSIHSVSTSAGRFYHITREQ